MRVCYVLLAAVATLLASYEVVAISSREDVPKVAANEEIQSIDAVPKTVSEHRLLRTNKAAGEERLMPLGVVSFKDLMGVDDLVDKRQFGAFLGKTEDAINNRRAIFDAMFARPEYRDHVLKVFDEAGHLKSLRVGWNWYRLYRGKMYEKQVEDAVAAAARGAK